MLNDTDYDTTKRTWWLKAFETSERYPAHFVTFVLLGYVTLECIKKINILKLKERVLARRDKQDQGKSKLVSYLNEVSEKDNPKDKQETQSITSFFFETQIGDFVLIRDLQKNNFLIGKFTSNLLWTSVTDLATIGTIDPEFHNPKDDIPYRKVSWLRAGSLLPLARNKASKVGYLCSFRDFSKIGEVPQTHYAKDDLYKNSQPITGEFWTSLEEDRDMPKQPGLRKRRKRSDKQDFLDSDEIDDFDPVEPKRGTPRKPSKQKEGERTPKRKGEWPGEEPSEKRRKISQIFGGPGIASLMDLEVVPRSRFIQEPPELKEQINHVGTLLQQFQDGGDRILHTLQSLRSLVQMTTDISQHVA